ncbi:MAG: DUF11 domain-containing protein [Planctomycetaceae bacterium]|nr:DUF11 domain-containing protein [Planctomycetaceae bacterium]
MRQPHTHHSVLVEPRTIARPAWPNAWRMVLIAVCVLILSSCRSPGGMRRAACPHEQAGAGSLPAEAYTGAPPAAMAAGVACAAQEPWSPPGIRKPWPSDEYLCDGGDAGRPAMRNGHGNVDGVEMEDTVAKYETHDGQTAIEPSNRVCVYSPRFGAVRQVVSLAASQERQQLGGVHTPVRLEAPTTRQLVGHAKQHVQAGDQIAARPAVAMRTRQGDGAMSSAVGPRGFQDSFKPYENLSIVRLGAYKEAEMAFLAKGTNAAIAWSHTDALQILLDSKGAQATVKFDQAQSTYTVSHQGCARLRLVKVASTASAKPGDEVAFTLRFDNVGDEPLTNVVIIDSLSTRLEFVPGSAQCSLDATFATHPNEGDSLAIRCELAKPLAPCKGGVVRFRCRVR